MLTRLLHDPLAFNNDAYYQIAGDDADFLIGGDIARVDFRTQLRGLLMPVLIIAGRFDRITIPRYSIRYKQYAPQADFVMFEKSGHYPYIEEAGSCFSAVREFLMK
jgi:proline iminopeptidase